MKSDSLWFDLFDNHDGTAKITLRRCLNCGEIKVISEPCGFDHLAAYMEFHRDITRLKQAEVAREATT